MTKRQVALFVVVSFSLLGGLDIYLVLDDVPGNTYSEIIRKWGYSMRWLPFLIAAFFGALLTHWFAKPYKLSKGPQASVVRRKRPLKDRLIMAGGLLIIVVIGMCLGFLW